MLKEVKILGCTYRVREVPVVSKAEFDKARIDYLTGEIVLDETMSEDIKEVALMHEIVHAICDLQGMSEIGTDECKVQSLAVAFRQVIKENGFSRGHEIVVTDKNGGLVADITVADSIVAEGYKVQIIEE